MHDDAAADPTFHAWAMAAEAVRATTKRLEKSAVLERYLPTLDDAALIVAAHYFSGIVFPRHDMRTTQVGGAMVFAALEAISGMAAESLHERYVSLGDAGDLARALYEERPGGAPPASGVTLVEMQEHFAALSATSGSLKKRAFVRDFLAPLGALEAQYAVKLLLGSGELRIGLKEAQVEEALARAFGRPLADLRRANLLRGDVGEIAVLARAGTLGSATLALFHPIGFMLAQPLETAAEIAAALPTPFALEDKYDGIRAQAHLERPAAGGPVRVALFSRTLDDITRGYPDVVLALQQWADDPANVASGSGTVLDGELLAFDSTAPARALPFKALQSRLGRKAPTAALQAAVPVSLVVYDVLAMEGALVVDEPYSERRARLVASGWPDASHATAAARLAPMRLVTTPAEVEQAFDLARAAGNEGLIAKDPGSAYTPGRRGKTWIKLKKATATLDVVITGAERGHGRRRAVLSDYTFAVRASTGADAALLNVGKAYNGLTDVEIAELTSRLEAITIERFGRFQSVQPVIVLEVTFDAVQRSARHKAGFALRFPRILRIRDDKPASEIDTLARVRELAGEMDGDANDDAENVDVAPASAGTAPGAKS